MNRIFPKLTDSPNQLPASAKSAAAESLLQTERIGVIMVSRADEHENALHHFENACRQNGLSITPQRTAIFKELVSSSEHPSAAVIFRKIREYYDNISLDTVNRTLLTFNEIGLAKIVESSGDPKRFDPNLAPHHHFRCARCGKIVDFENPAYDALDVPRAIRKKFVIREKRVHLEGFCDTCRSPGE